MDEIYNLACPASPIHYQFDPAQRQPDITMAREKLGWEPKVPLVDGLKRTIDYFENLLREHGNERKSNDSSDWRGVR